VRAHRLALATHRKFWAALLRDNIPFADLQRTMGAMQRSEGVAQQVYRK
jgi:hypothetical protein